MPKATQRERDRAKRLRRKERLGKTLDTEQSDWLRAYERDRAEMRATRYGKPPAPPSPSPPQAPDSPPTPLPEPTAHRSPLTAAPSVPPPTSPPRLVPLPSGFFDAHREPDAKPDDKASACTIENCPHCKMKDAALVCGTTGAKVYSPMSDEEGQAAAALLLFVIGLVIALFKKKPSPRPTDREKRALGRATSDLVYRYANPAGQAAPFLAFGWALTSYAGRAVRSDGE